MIVESSFLRFGRFVHYLQVGLGGLWRIYLLWLPVRDYVRLWTGISPCWHLQYCWPDGVGRVSRAVLPSLCSCLIGVRFERSGALYLVARKCGAVWVIICDARWCCCGHFVRSGLLSLR